MPYSKIFLKPGKEAAVKRFHPWIFSGAVDRAEGNPKEGDIVEIRSNRNEFLAFGHFTPGNIVVKIFEFQPTTIDENYWISRLKQSFSLRTRLGLTNHPQTNAYRLVFTEGDGLPGLVIDYYNGVAVFQTHTQGMHLLKPIFVKALQKIYGSSLKAIYDKSGETMKSFQSGKKSPQNQPSGDYTDHYLMGTSQVGEILETGQRFMVDWEHGQKTGFFLDQRANRMFAQFYAKDKKVLNVFCYSGAFSVFALQGGASLVHSVDSSQRAIDWTEENIRLNGFVPDRHQSYVADAKKWLTEVTEKYDMIILDPPAFAKTHIVTNNALHAYIHINAQALKRLTPGGLLFTFSCSQAISHDMFQSALMSAALETGRKVKILHRLSQGPDHPVSIYHPEGEYLKGLILEVE
ncbi:MAG: class I SAM-dependent rRNA methyltransferase [Bacteroidales bacterium]|nr:class I SAM-dependent rRNA methyltransferase [Bacteroidales bacterium]